MNTPPHTIRTESATSFHRLRRAVNENFVPASVRTTGVTVGSPAGATRRAPFRDELEGDTAPSVRRPHRCRKARGGPYPGRFLIQYGHVFRTRSRGALGALGPPPLAPGEC